MDELKLKDESKSGSRDRRPMYSKKPISLSYFSVFRKNLTISCSILVLLFLIVGIILALKEPRKHEAIKEERVKIISKEINLFDSSSPVAIKNATIGVTTDTSRNIEASTKPQTKNSITTAINSIPKQAEPSPLSGAKKQSIQMPGDMVNELSSQEERIDPVIQGKMEMNPILPQTSETAMNSTAKKDDIHPIQKSALKAKTIRKLATTNHQTATKMSVSAEADFAKEGIVSSSFLKSAKWNFYTLQLSSTSLPNTLHAYAKKKKLKNYLVYSTKHHGKPWYVLVNGCYLSYKDAKSAIVALPKDIQVKKPWVRSARRVQEEIKK